MSDIKNWTSARQIWNGVFQQQLPIPPENMIYELLSNGATTNMNVDGSVTPVEFEYECPDNNVAFLHRNTLHMVDGGIIPTTFAGVSALANGVEIQIIDSDGTTILLDYTKGRTMTTNTDFALLAGPDFPVLAGTGNGDDVMSIRWTLSKAGGPLLLTEGQIFRVTINDDISGITHMHWMMQGAVFPDGIFNDA